MTKKNRESSCYPPTNNGRVILSGMQALHAIPTQNIDINTKPILVYIWYKYVF